MTKLWEQFGKEVLIGSGAIGTVLRGSAVTSAGPVEYLNLSSPELVTELHEQYREAGSQILISNTFAANPIALKEISADDLCTIINSKGVEMARAAAGSELLVWGSVGPLGLALEIDDYSAGQIADIYAEQCNGLIKADAILLETFTSPREAEGALKAAKQTGLPVILQFGNVGRLPSAETRIDKFIKLAEDYGVSAIGVNCQYPEQIVKTVGYLAGRTELPITASANAGHPQIVRGVINYEYPPDRLADIAEELVKMGVAEIGGCCGTTPEHVRAIAALKGSAIAERSRIESVSVKDASSSIDKEARKNRIREVIESDAMIVSVEIRAERKSSLAEIIENTHPVADAGADMFDVPDNPGAAVGRDAMVVASKLQEGTGVASIPHLTVTQSNLLRLHSSLIGCWDLGLDGLLAITGDAPTMGHLGDMVSRVKDVKSSVELLRLVRRMSEGETMVGDPIGDTPDLYAGCSVSSIATTGRINWLIKKIEAGANFCFSQPFFDLDDFKRLYEHVSDLPVRFLPGIMPLAGKGNAEFLAAGHIPGIQVPEELVEKISGYEKTADQRKFAHEHALELALKIADISKGIYLIMPFGKACYTDSAAIVKALKS